MIWMKQWTRQWAIGLALGVGCVCGVQAVPLAVGLGTAKLHGDDWQGPFWVGTTTGYWVPNGTLAGLSIGGIYAVVPIDKSSAQPKNPSKGLELCPHSQQEHLLNGKKVQRAAHHQITRKRNCNHQ